MSGVSSIGETGDDNDPPSGVDNPGDIRVNEDACHPSPRKRGYPQKKTERKRMKQSWSEMQWFDINTTIPRENYKDQSAFTVSTTEGWINLPHVSSRCPYPTLSSDMCDRLCESLFRARGFTERCAVESSRNNGDQHAVGDTIGNTRCTVMVQSVDMPWRESLPFLSMGAQM